MTEMILKNIEDKIFVIRGQKVMVDSDLAELYGIATKVLNQAVKRNQKRFPDDFMFQLTDEEYANLRSQFVTSSLNYGGRRYQPLVFTENGVAMLSSVLKSDNAIEVNIAIMRIFTKLRSFLAFEKDLTQRVDNLDHDTTAMFKVVFQKLDELDRNVGELNQKLPAYPADRKKIGLKAEDD